MIALIVLLQILFHSLDTTGASVLKLVKSEDVQNSSLSRDLAPGLCGKRTWGRWEAKKLSQLAFLKHHLLLLPSVCLKDLRNFYQPHPCG